VTDHLLAGTLAATVFAFSMGSSSVAWAVRLGSSGRWLMLLLLAAVAAVAALPYLRLVPRSLTASYGLLTAVALVSAVWSVKPRLTLERGATFALLGLVAALIAARARGREQAMTAVFLGLLAGALAVAAAGALVYLFDHALAVQPPAPNMPARLRGFGQNPNTSAMLFALTLPVAEWIVVSAERLLVRVTALAAAVALYAEIMASGSRGAMLASAAGTFVFLALALRRLPQLAAAELVAAGFFLFTFHVAGSRPPAPTIATPTPPSMTTTSSTGPGGATTSTPTPAPAPSSRFDVELGPSLPLRLVPVPFVPRRDEIGYPTLYRYKPILAYGSGRVYAWTSALRKGLHRPISGYGFGTEPDVFVDRSYFFQGSYAENSFVGMFLQLGTLGILLLAAPFVIVAAATVRAARRSFEERRLMAVALSTVIAGLVVAFFQSYLYSVGNVATLTLWAATFVAAAAAQGGER
jgi:hypothetical protein